MTTIDRDVQRAITEIKDICNRAGSTSQYFTFGGEGYKSCVRHFLESSAEIAAGAVQPGSAADLAEIIKVIAEHKVPFAVKGGGHATNPGLSSTKGIQISMCRFNKIEVEENTANLLPPGSPEDSHSIVHIGAGCLFDEVCREVVPKKLNIVGGSSIGGVGVAGWLLGGGYSLKTNQHGLGIDNILQVKVVLPIVDEANPTKMTVKTVNVLSEGDDKELFEAIKGGGNNFGVITEFTVRAHDQEGPTCGCLLQYEVEDYEEVKAAIARFARQQDPKASIVAAFRYFNNPGGIQSKLTVQCFYDGPRPEDDGPFAELLGIDHTTEGGGGDTVGWESKPPAALALVPPAEFKLNFGPNLYIGAPKRSELVEYANYQHFDHRTSFINEALDTKNISVEEMQLPPPPAYSYVEKVGTGAPLKMAISLDTTINSSVFGGNESASILSPSSQDYIKRAMAGVGEHPRGRWGNVMVDVYRKKIIDEIERQASKAARQMPGHGGKRVVIDIWPFTKSMFDKATECAWPHVKGSRNGPILAYFLWEGSENDAFWINTMERALRAIKKKVDEARHADGDVKPLPVYINTTLHTTRVEDIYGDHYEKLRESRKKFDPERVMDLTQGFKIPHPEVEVEVEYDDDEMYN